MSDLDALLARLFLDGGGGRAVPERTSPGSRQSKQKPFERPRGGPETRTDEVQSTMYMDGDPPLLLTHVPLRVVPDGCVNIYGHLHQKRVPGTTRHINACVEQLQYQPKAVTALRALAGNLVNGGCRMMFPFRNFEVNQVVPQARGGQDSPETSRSSAAPATAPRAQSQAELIAKVKTRRMLAA